MGSREQREGTEAADMTHRVGLVGLKQAQAFIDIFNQMPDTEVAALCDIDAELLQRVGEEHGIAQRFADFEDLAAADIDIVSLSTPIQVHGAHAVEALRRGKHVLCQYIAANDPAEANALVQAAARSGAKYMVIETDCYERRNMVMMALARQGAFGELTMGRGHYIHDCKSLGRNPDGSLTWRGELWMQGRGGSVSAVHTALPLLQTFGERVEEVYAYGPGARTLPEFNWYDRVTTIGRLPSGRTLEFVIDVFSWRPHVFGYTLQGTRGCFEFDRAAFVEDGQLSDWKHLDELEGAFDLGDVIRDAGGHGSAWEAIIREFIAAIDGDRSPAQGLADALHITAIGWAAEESLATGQPARVMTFDVD